ncbi:hypothetical protein AVEN_108580-1 [Araneus ventricosus]|uniref:Uncharacterized protein n=1 Tax=Araneus ventricosus TaxID=182803 RepID=A0A4Y2DGU0_ARAVE|nr:hypothetical protein AVEN_108580-1 [Araneus ventricosus]
MLPFEVAQRSSKLECNGLEQGRRMAADPLQSCGSETYSMNLENIHESHRYKGGGIMESLIGMVALTCTYLHYTIHYQWSYELRNMYSEVLHPHVKIFKDVIGITNFQWTIARLPVLRTKEFS